MPSDSTLLVPPLPGRVSLDVQGATAIRQAIIDGVLHPGRAVNETALGTMLGISRSTARTALRLLELEGLVVQQQYKGWRIFMPTAQDALDLYMLRGALEGVAAATVAQRADPASLARIAMQYEAMQAAATEGVMQRMSASDHAFHTQIVLESGNPRLVDQYQLVQQHIKIYVATANRIRGRFRDIVHDHDAMKDAILAGHAADAEGAARDHSRVAGAMIADMLASAPASAL